MERERLDPDVWSTGQRDAGRCFVHITVQLRRRWSVFEWERIDRSLERTRWSHRTATSPTGGSQLDLLRAGPFATDLRCRREYEQRSAGGGDVEERLVPSGGTSGPRWQLISYRCFLRNDKRLYCGR